MPFALIKKIKNSISLRIAFLFCVTFSVGLVFAYGVTYFELSYSLEKSSREILSAKLQEAKTLLATEGISGLRHFLSLEKNRILNAPYLVRVLTNTGETLYLKPSVQDKIFDFKKAFNQKINADDLLGWKSLPAIDDEDKFILLTEKIDQNLYVQVGTSSEDRDDILEQILFNFAIIEIILVFMSAFFGFWYSRKSLAPLRDLLTTIRLIEKGNLSQRVPALTSKDELQDIGDTFNRMITRIEKLIRAMHESLDYVAHDIRTPLTRIRVVAEDALLSQNPKLIREALEDASESAGGISELVAQLLSISEAEAGALVLQYESIDIRLLLIDVVEIYEFIAHDKKISIELSSVPTGLLFSVDRKRIKQVIANLIDNAIKFSAPDTRIEIAATMNIDSLRIDIKDQGSGISDEDKTRIWDRLFRGDKSRSQKGLGLGLAIVRAIVLAHKGSIEVSDATSKGTIFSIILPKVDNPDYIHII